ncbi:hypothetical protein ACFX15_023407 [Malus domestica]
MNNVAEKAAGIIIGFSSSLSKIQSLSKISYFSFKPVSLSRTPSPLPSVFHFLDENDSLPSSSVTSMSAVAPKRKIPRPVKYDDENPAVQNNPISSTAKVVADQPAKAQRESIRPESNAVSKSRPVNDESESRNVKTSKEEPQSPKKEPTGIKLDDKREEITLTKPDVKFKRRGLNQSSIYLTNNSRFKEDGENQNPNLSTPPMNQAKAMKATLKSSTEKKQPIESTTPNNEVLPKLRSTLSARNIMLGPNYDEEINKTLVCLY